MGLLGYALGGALQGLGQGIENQAVAQRNAALEAMRQRYETAKSDRDYARQTTRDETQHGYKMEETEAGYKERAGLLALGAGFQEKRDATNHVYKLDEIKTTTVGQQETAKLKARLDAGNTAAEIRLRDQLDSGDISNVVRGQDGQYYGVTKGGLTPTGIMGAPTAAETGETGGGRLTESEQAAAYNDDRKAWRDAGRKGPEPKASDYIGMTRSSYRSRQTGEPEKPKVAAPEADDMALAISQLATVYPNATPDRYPGLFRDGKKIPLSEARRVVEQRYR